MIPCLVDRRILSYFSLLSTTGKTAQTSGNYPGSGLFELVTYQSRQRGLPATYCYLRLVNS